MTYSVPLPRLGTFDTWRDAARGYARAAVPASEISWAVGDTGASLFDQTAPCPAAMRELTVPKAFVPLARQLCASRAPGAFELAYRLLCRVADAPRLLSNRADADVAQAEKLTKHIRRDMHKMKAFVRFREITEADAPRRSFVAWFEPDHRIEELVGGFFARRFADMDWAIVTPEVTTRFRSGTLTFDAVESAPPALQDETEELWRTYYANIFNPARLKVRAMTSEMPKKYWKNLPEADLIPDLIAKAEVRAREMQDAAPTFAPTRAARILDRLPARANDDALAGLSGCDRCALAQLGNAPVPGEGPKDAPLMIVGEQPGDAEDRAGRPFIGPAGQLFDQIAVQAGLDRRAAYVTNAVKHFKFQMRGQRRIHQNPNNAEVDHCRWWLTREIAQVQPRLILAMGAVAARALTGDGSQITRRRGTVEMGLDGIPVFLSNHPAALLRTPDPQMKADRTEAFRADLTAVAQILARFDAEENVQRLS